MARDLEKAFSSSLESFQLWSRIVEGRGSNSKADNPYAYKWLGQLKSWKEVTKKARDFETDSQVRIG